MSAVSMLFGGDALPRLSAESPDPLYAVRGIVASAHIAFVNLEAAIAPGGSADGETHAPGAPAYADAAGAKKKNVLRTSAQAAAYLKDVGFHVVNIANNHTFDLGQQGCAATIRALREQDLGVLGLRDGTGALPVVMERAGARVGFLGYADYGFPGTLMDLRETVVTADIRRLRGRVDLVVVSLHWGYEYVGSPSPRQRRMAHALVDAGAALIVGQHPHVSQGIERYRGALICYSLGNFLFPVDEMPLPASRDARDAQYGFLLRTRADRSGIRDFDVLPVSAFQRESVALLSGSLRARSLARLGRLSRGLERRRPGYAAWLWDASRTFAPLFRAAWKWRCAAFGPRELLGAARELVNDPILVPLLFISFLRGRA